MEAQEVSDLMQRFQQGTGQQRLALRCDCENLETVHVIVDQSGSVLVTDDHRTFQYLDIGNNSTYVAVENLDLEAVRQVCEECGVELKPATPDSYPAIQCVLRFGEPLSAAIARVAEAIDGVFSLARRPDLR